MPFTSTTLPDLFEAVGSARMRPPSYLLNDAMSNTTTVGRFFMAELRKVIQGGTSMRHDIMLSQPKTFKMRDLDEVVTPTRSNVLTQWAIPWRKAYDYYNVTEDETLYAPSGGNPEADEGAFMEFINFEKKQMQSVMTSTYEGLADKLWAVPDTTKMEASGGLEPYCVPAYVNEETGRLYGSETAAPGGAWSTVEGINTASPGKYRFRNRVVGYLHSAHNQDTALVTGGHQRTMIEALDDAIEIAAFEGPRGMGVDRYFTNTPAGASQDRSRRVIIASLRGKSELRFLYRSKQDAFIKQTDPWASDVQFAGHDVLREPRLETQALYKAQASTALVTEGDAAGYYGPRLYVLNLGHMFVGVHKQRYFYRYPVQVHPFQPWNQTIYYGLHFNLGCESRMRQVLVSPGTVTGTFDSATGEVLTRAPVGTPY